MPKYQRKPEIVTATQWFKLGDHPSVYVLKEWYRLGKTYEGAWVHPSDWIVESPTSTHVMSDVDFKEKYEQVVK